MKCILIAHRCGPGTYPEQSIASARHALSLGADMVEMDVQYTSDDKPVICHDPGAGRIFGVDKRIRDISFAEFMSYRQVIDRAYPSHSLDDVLSEPDVRPLLLHCKFSGELLKDLVDHLVFRHAEKTCVCGVLQAPDVETIKTRNDSLKVLSFMPHLDQLEGFLASRADAIRLWEDWVTQDRIDMIHACRKQVWVMAGKPTQERVGYTSEEHLKKWVSMGVDGILVNDINWARSRLGV